MGSSLGPSLANAFLSNHEMYVDGIFILKSNDCLKYFQDFLKGMNYSFSTLKLHGKNLPVNPQPQFIKNFLSVLYIVTLNDFYLQFINLVWYML